MLCFAANASLSQLFPAYRHAELVSASIYQPHPSVSLARWTLERQSPKVKQVQGDDYFEILALCSTALL